MELVSVAGPRWSPRPDSPVRRAARIAAAKDATARAAEYAEAFGAGLGELTEAAGTGLLPRRRQRPASMGWRAASGPVRGSAAGRGGEAPSLDIEPARQAVTAQAGARFAMVRQA